MKTLKIGILVSAFLASSGVSAAAQHWAGGYFGGQLNYGMNTARDVTFGPGDFDVNGVGAGVFAGYNLQQGAFVFGVEANLNVSSAEGTNNNFLRPLREKNDAALIGRIGYDAGNWMPFAMVGVHSTELEGDHDGNGVDMASERFTGFSYGLGVDIALKRKGFTRFSIERTEYEDNVLGFANGTDPHTVSYAATRVYIGYGLQF